MSKIYLRPSGQSFEIAQDQSLLECLRSNGVYIKSSCGGVASCTDCVVKIVSGEDNLTTPPFEELQLLGNVFHITKERLACQCKVEEGDVTIDISAHDKNKDEQRLKNKTTSFSAKNRKTHVRKKADIESAKRVSREKDEQAPSQEKKPKPGGMRRPKPFKSE